MHTIQSVIIGLLIERAHTAPATTPESIPTVSTLESIPTVSTLESIPTISTLESIPTISTLESIPTVSPPESIPTVSSLESIPTISSLESVPTISTLESIPKSIPTISSLESIPTVSSLESIPTISTLESVPTISSLESIPTVSPPESIPTVSTLESIPTVSTPGSTPPESTTFQTLIKQSPNEPTQTPEGSSQAPNSLRVPIKAVSVPTGKTDKTQLGTTDFRTVSSPSSSPTGKSLEIDFSDAQFGEHASLLLAPPNGRASFSLDVRKPPNIAPGELVNLTASIRVDFIGVPNPQVRSLFRRESTGSHLQIIMDEKSIYDKELETTGGKFEEVKSEKTAVSAHPRIEIIQKSGNNPVALTFRGLSLVKSESSTISR
ncbi:hypothetical protein FOQG_17588 [Fusarium oxysporum f. sp. raphani 54005]|uniref:Uncharacterized protein n=1 Tax=Fusarium oxysporum f. sp. raphani 54005 TaxID=1089458 RepID=X0B6H9_FUSOX|nr:hypothetical protein FOQG_17588 [Fusarium oxysporum f. sp. raphani 54005]